MSNTNAVDKEAFFRSDKEASFYFQEMCKIYGLEKVAQYCTAYNLFSTISAIHTANIKLTFDSLIARECNLNKEQFYILEFIITKTCQKFHKTKSNTNQKTNLIFNSLDKTTYKTIDKTIYYFRFILVEHRIRNIA